MAKRITVKEIDRFREKLDMAETDDEYIQEWRCKAVTYLELICDQLEYKGKKSMKLMELKEE